MHIPIQKAIEDLQNSNNLFVNLFAHGSLEIELYKPEKEDLQKPHLKDEVYIIISGSGEFLNNGIITNFKSGDLIFVAASIEHRFLNFTEDFKTWVIFYGPNGGEG